MKTSALWLVERRVRVDYARIPIFPLPESVLFPRTHLPLHIFEPRYRKMTEDCVADGMPIAICLAERGEDLAGAPRVHPVAGVGVIERHERLPDGRFNIVLRGVSRMRIEDEVAPKGPYRMVRAIPLEDHWPNGDKHSHDAGLADLAETLRACVHKIASFSIEPHIAAEVFRRLAAAKDESLLADTVAGMFVGEAIERQAVLEELDVAKRLLRVTSSVSELLLRADAVRRGGKETPQ